MALLRFRHISVDLPPRWEGRIFDRVPGGEGTSVVHIANFALPPNVAHYGGGAVERMGAQDAFASILEFGVSSVEQPLFASSGLPRLTPALFDQAVLQRGLPGQSGVQRFFNQADRAYCLYAVLGAHEMRWRSVPALAQALRGVRLT